MLDGSFMLFIPCIPVEDPGATDYIDQLCISYRLIEHVGMIELVDPASDVTSASVVLGHLILRVQHTNHTNR